MVPIGFVSDHMEVIYDLDTEALATAERLGLPVRAARPPPGSTRGSSRWSATCCSSGPPSSAARRWPRHRRVARPRSGTSARSAAARTRAADRPALCGEDVVTAAPATTSCSSSPSTSPARPAELVRERRAAASRSRPPSPAPSTWSPRPTGPRAADPRARCSAPAPTTASSARRATTSPAPPASLDRRPDRRHRELPLRHPAVRRLDRRRARRRGRSPAWWSTSRPATSSPPPSAAAPTATATDSGSAAADAAGPAAGRHRLQLRVARASRSRPWPSAASCCPRSATSAGSAPAALDLCSVAAGALDGVRRGGPQPWDLAAGGLVATAAGARRRDRLAGVGGRLLRRVPPGATASTSSGLRSREAGYLAGAGS